MARRTTASIVGIGFQADTGKFTSGVSKVSKGMRDTRFQSNKLEGALRKLNRGFSNGLKANLGFARSLGGLGGAATAAGAAVVGLGVSIGVATARALQGASQIQAVTTRLQTLAGLNERQAERGVNRVRDVAASVGRDGVAAAQSFFTAVSSGLSGADAAELVQASLRGSVVGLGQVGQVARNTGLVFNVYGKQAGNAADITGTFISILKTGNIPLEQFNAALAPLVPLGKTLGLSLAEVGAGLATVSTVTDSASIASTQIQGFLSTLIKPSQQAREELERLGTSVEELRNIASEQGLARAVNFLGALVGGDQDAQGRLFRNRQGLLGFLNLYVQQGQKIIRTENEIREANRKTLDEAYGKAAQDAINQKTAALERSEKAWEDLGEVLLPVRTAFVQLFSFISRNIAFGLTALVELAIQLYNTLAQIGGFISGLFGIDQAAAAGRVSGSAPRRDDNLGEELTKAVVQNTVATTKTTNSINDLVKETIESTRQRARDASQQRRLNRLTSVERAEQQFIDSLIGPLQERLDNLNRQGELRVRAEESRLRQVESQQAIAAQQPRSSFGRQNFPIVLPEPESNITPLRQRPGGPLDPERGSIWWEENVTEPLTSGVVEGLRRFFSGQLVRQEQIAGPGGPSTAEGIIGQSIFDQVQEQRRLRTTINGLNDRISQDIQESRQLREVINRQSPQDAARLAAERFAQIETIDIQRSIQIIRGQIEPNTAQEIELRNAVNAERQRIQQQFKFLEIEQRIRTRIELETSGQQFAREIFSVQQDLDQALSERLEDLRIPITVELEGGGVVSLVQAQQLLVRLQTALEAGVNPFSDIVPDEQYFQVLRQQIDGVQEAIARTRDGLDTNIFERFFGQVRRGLSEEERIYNGIVRQFTSAFQAGLTARNERIADIRRQIQIQSQLVDQGVDGAADRVQKLRAELGLAEEAVDDYTQSWVRGRPALEEWAEAHAATVRQVEQVEQLSQSFSNAFETAFEDIIFNAKSLEDAFKQLVQTIIQEIIRIAIIRPLAQQLGGGLANLFGGGTGVPGFASGGLAGAGFAVVGERGPELVDFQRPARVYNNAELAAALGNRGGGGGPTFIYNIQSTDGPGVRAAGAEIAANTMQQTRTAMFEDLSDPTSALHQVVKRVARS